ncbi:hypothetical protein [Candidatus Sororendozoicomonas aggregata]|uniref:hypothetical protein n=1 Tax=Candidatus Sororendozoicomonas aggregata TaxID=3073239 RepID=UPI002ED4266A
MKKSILYFSLPALILWAASNVYASSCKEDFNKMHSTVVKDTEIFSKNGKLMVAVSGPVTTHSSSCGAWGWGPGVESFRAHYKLSWTKGNWENTLITQGG